MIFSKAWRCPTLAWGDPKLPLALSDFTSEFEMGSGGSHLLLPPDKLVGHSAKKLQNNRNWKANNTIEFYFNCTLVLHTDNKPSVAFGKLLGVIWSSLTVN